MWYHETSLDWLKVRQLYITASDIYELKPNKSGRPKDVAKKCRQIFAAKHKRLSAADCVSTGAAARGHILEPYAIAAFSSASGIHLEHWDDVLVPALANMEDFRSRLAFSPDAVSFSCPKGTVVCGGTFPEDTIIGEVKSYNAERHLECVLTERTELEERYQLATAMVCQPNISRGYLIFYNPSFSPCPLYYTFFERDELEEEMKDVCDALDVYAKHTTQISYAVSNLYNNCKPADLSTIINEGMLEEKLFK